MYRACRSKVTLTQCKFKPQQQHPHCWPEQKSEGREAMATLLLCLSLLLAAVVQFSPVDSALPCNSPLRRYLPHRFTHCSSLSCSYGQWSPWKTSIPQVMAVANYTCDSGEARRYERSRTAVPGSTCTPDPATEYKFECKQLQSTTG